jgi:hypothetical protein
VSESLRIYLPGVNAQPRISPPRGCMVLGQRIPAEVGTS